MNSMSLISNINMIKDKDAWLPLGFGCPGYCTTVESRFLDPHVFEPHHKSNQYSFPSPQSNNIEFTPSSRNARFFELVFFLFGDSRFHCVLFLF